MMNICIKILSLGFLLSLLVLPFIERDTKLLGFLEANRCMTILIIVMIYVILSLGLNVVPGWIGLLELGYVAFVAIGAYATAIIAGLPCMQFGGGFVVALLCAGAICAVIGLLRGIPTLKLSGDYYAIVTFAFAEIVGVFILSEVWLTKGPMGFGDFPPITLAYDTFEGKANWDEELQQFTWEGKDRSEIENLLKIEKKVNDQNEAHIEVTNIHEEDKLYIYPRGESDTYFASSRLASKDSISITSHEGMVGLSSFSFYVKRGSIEIIEKSNGFYFLILGMTALFFIAMYFLENSRVGRAWMAIRADEVSAAAVGVNLSAYKMLGFAISAFVGGVGGGLLVYQIGMAAPNSFDFWISVIVLCCIVLGSMGSLKGVVIGTLLLKGSEELLREGFPLWDAAADWSISPFLQELEILRVSSEGVTMGVPTEWRYLVIGVLMVIIMIFRPSGLIPVSRRTKPIAKSELDKTLSNNTKLYGLKKK